jgi:hypothetical protein
MAISLEQIRNATLTSIHGPRLGIDGKEYLVGVKSVRIAVEDISTTVATSAINYGITRVLTSGSSQGGRNTLQAPVVGVLKTLVLNSTSTGGQQFTATSATIYTASAGTTSAVVNLFAPGASVQLFGVTTDRWVVVGGSLGTTTTPLVTFTTST